MLSISAPKSQAITHALEHLLNLTYEEYKLHKAGVTGVAVPEAGCDAGDGPGDGTSPSGSLRYAFKKFRQFALDGTKWPATEKKNPPNERRRTCLSNSQRTTARTSVVPLDALVRGDVEQGARALLDDDDVRAPEDV